MNDDQLSQAQQDSAERDEVGRKNRQKLSELLRDNPAIFISRASMDVWRPTVETDGYIEGLEHLGPLTCICTDGLLAWFLRAGSPPFFGHVQRFRWNEPVVSMVPYLDEHGRVRFFKQVKDLGAPSAFFRTTPKPRPRSTPKKPKGTLLERALDLLSRSNVWKNEHYSGGEADEKQILGA